LRLLRRPRINADKEQRTAAVSSSDPR
jgi:hypothetical protein